jgi:archaellin
MYPKSIQTLEAFLSKRKQRFVDILLWHLYLAGEIDNKHSLGLHQDTLNCINSLSSLAASGEYASEEQLLHSYLTKCELSLVPDDHISWIDKKDARQCNFIWLKLKHSTAFEHISSLSLQGNANKYYIAIKMLDRVANNEQKQQLLLSIQQSWQQAKSYNGWRYHWLDMDSDPQCENAVKFLTKTISEKAKGYDKPVLVDDDNELTNYYKFLASVDLWTATVNSKLMFYNKITDAARKWKTPQQKQQKLRIKAKAKEDNHLLLNDKQTIEMLQTMQSKLGRKTINDTLDYIVKQQYKQLCAEKSASDQQPEMLEVTQLNKTLSSFITLKQRAVEQLKTLCDHAVKLQKAGIIDNKMNMASQLKSKQLYQVKEQQLLAGIINVDDDNNNP